VVRVGSQSPPSNPIFRSQKKHKPLLSHNKTPG